MTDYIQKINAKAGFTLLSNTGSPEGATTGYVGQTYLDTSTGILYTKKSGDDTNTGWEAQYYQNTLALWDTGKDPSNSNNIRFGINSAATFSGNATWDGTENAIRLTEAISNQSGQANFTAPLPPLIKATFNFKAGGGNGADATFFYVFSDAVVTQESGTGATKGITIGFSEFNDAITIYDNGNQASALISVGQPNIDDNNYHEAVIEIGSGRIKVFYDGTQKINEVIDTINDRTNPNFGFGARTGGNNNNHWIRDFKVEKL
jgi:hypothetical protein